MVGSEVYSSEVKKTEVLMENFRRAIGGWRPVQGRLPMRVLGCWLGRCPGSGGRGHTCACACARRKQTAGMEACSAMMRPPRGHRRHPAAPQGCELCHVMLPLPAGLRIKETKEVYEGEVTELTPVETENPGGGYGKVCGRAEGGGRSSCQGSVGVPCGLQGVVGPRPPRRSAAAATWSGPPELPAAAGGVHNRTCNHPVWRLPPSDCLLQRPCLPSAGGEPCGDWAEDGEGHQAAEAGPGHLRQPAGMVPHVPLCSHHRSWPWHVLRPPPSLPPAGEAAVSLVLSPCLLPPRHCPPQKEKVAAGDVIYIEANSGSVKRVGR